MVGTAQVAAQSQEKMSSVKSHSAKCLGHALLCFVAQLVEGGSEQRCKKLGESFELELGHIVDTTA